MTGSGGGGKESWADCGSAARGHTKRRIPDLGNTISKIVARVSIGRNRKKYAPASLFGFGLIGFRPAPAAFADQYRCK
jgi:hypothetical protein